MLTDDGYSRGENYYGGSLVCNMVLIYSPDGTSIKRWGVHMDMVWGRGDWKLENCVPMGHFLSTCSDTFDVGSIV